MVWRPILSERSGTCAQPAVRRFLVTVDLYRCLSIQNFSLVRIDPFLILSRWPWSPSCLPSKSAFQAQFLQRSVWKTRAWMTGPERRTILFLIQFLTKTVNLFNGKTTNDFKDTKISNLTASHGMFSYVPQLEVNKVLILGIQTNNRDMHRHLVGFQIFPN
jgi:hypothetical protein